MPTAIPQAAPPLRAVDPALEQNSATIAEARNKLHELLSRLRSEHHADILKLASTTVTNADVATFRFDDFTAKWIQLKERFERNREAIVTFARDLQTATDAYMEQNKPDLIQFFNKRIEAEREELVNQTKADEAIGARIERLESLVTKLQSYEIEQTLPSYEIAQTSQTGQTSRTGQTSQSSQTPQIEKKEILKRWAELRDQVKQIEAGPKKRNRKPRPKKQSTSKTKTPRAQQTTKPAAATKKASKGGKKSGKKTTKKAAKK